MVVIHVKRTEADQFLYECTCADSNDKIIRDLANIWNNRERIIRLGGACEELTKHGPMKAEAERGLDDIQERDGKVIQKGPYYWADPLGNRNGNGPGPQLCEVVAKTVDDAMSVIAKGKAAAGIALTAAALEEKISLIGGAVTMAYPMGLPENDTVRLLLQDPDGSFLESQMGHDYMDPNTATLWWAGKEFFRDQTVGDRVGRNEKTKIIARLQRSGGGAPVREAAVSEEERKNMMAWYFKKQEEEKALAENDEDSYLNSSWANPKALKSELLGTSSVSWKAASTLGAGRR